MGQQEVLDYLIRIRLTGNNDFITISDISKGVGSNQGDIRRHVNRLYLNRVLELRHEGWWKRKFRVRSCFLNDDKSNPKSVKKSQSFPLLPRNCNNNNTRKSRSVGGD